MASSFSPAGFNPRMIMGQPGFILVAIAILGIGGYLLWGKLSGGSAGAQPSGHAAQVTDTTLATGTLDTIQQQISVFEQQIASIPTTPHVPVSNSPVPVGTTGHSAT